MAKNYGITYQGSKSKLISKIVKHFPSADNFYDLFGGGFSVSHYILEECQNKFKNVHYNEVDENLVTLIQKAISGFYNYDNFTPEFIDRETFFKTKESDAYIKFNWSFGNDGKSYLYGRHIEEDKKALHNAVVFNILNDRAQELLGVVSLPSDAVSIEQRRLFVSKLIRNKRKSSEHSEKFKGLEKLQALGSLKRYQALEGLQNHLKKLHFSALSYENVSIKENSVIYCDIPYKNTSGYNIKFDHEKFFNWANELQHPVFISEYNLTDDRFYLIDTFEHRTTKGSNVNNKVVEKLYCNKFAFDLLNNR